MRPTKPKLRQTIDDVALEIEALLRDTRAAWHLLTFGHKISVASACLMFAGTFLPWLSVSSLPTQIGLNAGGIFHVQLAIGTIVLLQRMQQKKRQMDFSKDSFYANDYFEKRSALWLILIGAASTLAAIGILGYYASIHSTLYRVVDIRFGFYTSLLAGIGIASGGVLWFFNSCPKSPYD